MGKIWIEVCLISARGLRRTSSLFKLQWYGVGWIDPRNKYCTKIDASGNANPAWKTKFSGMVDDAESKFEELALNVEVYSREPIFLRQRLQGTATVILKEFLEKYAMNHSHSVEEVGSFQLRKKNSNKPQGFVDVSIRISKEREDDPISSFSGGNEEGIKLMDRNGINLNKRYGGGQMQTYPPSHLTHPSIHGPENQQQSQPNSSYAHLPMPLPANYTNSSSGGSSYPPSAGGPSYQPGRAPPPPPPPPSNVGYIPTFLPRNDRLPQTSYTNIPSSGAGRGGGPGFGMGLGAGALAAGAVIFGDDFMSGFEFPGGLQDASLNISTNPPF